MRKAVAFCSLVFLVGAAAIPFHLADTAMVKPKIAFFMLVPKNIEAIPLIDSIPSLLTMAISNFDYFEIIERKKIEREIELGGYKLGSIKDQDLFTLGERLGFDFCVVGDVLKQRGTIEVKIKVVDIRAQKVSGEQAFTTTEGRLNFEVNNVVAMIMERTRESFSTGVGPKKEEITIKPCQDLKVKSGTRTIRISWSHSDPKQVSGFRVCRAKSEEGPFMPIGTVDQMFFVDENPILKEPAFYRVEVSGPRANRGDYDGPTMPASELFVNPIFVRFAR